MCDIKTFEFTDNTNNNFIIPTLTNVVLSTFVANQRHFKIICDIDGCVCKKIKVFVDYKNWHNDLYMWVSCNCDLNTAKKYAESITDLITLTVNGLKN